MRTKGSQSKLMKIITMPARVLKKGRDLYVRSMMDYAQKPRYSSSSTKAASVKTEQVGSGLPKSFSTSVTTTRSTNYQENDDLRELIRASSTTHNNNRNMSLDVEGYLKQLIEEQKMTRQKLYDDHHSVLQQNVVVSKILGVPRSHSVGLGRIDECKSFEYEEEDGVEEEGMKKSAAQEMLRSRSYAVGAANRNNTLVF